MLALFIPRWEINRGLGNTHGFDLITTLSENKETSKIPV